MKSVLLTRAMACGVVAVLGMAACAVDGRGLSSVGTASDAGTDAPGGVTGAGGNGAGAGGAGARGGTPGAGGSAGSGAGGTASGGVTGSGGGGNDAAIDLATPDVPADPLGTGALCGANAECTSGFCVDGVCCETACSGTCVACTRDRTGEVDGQCRTVTVGTDPDSECELDTVNQCGHTGRCGAGACEVAINGKSCGESACTGTTFTPVPRCDGSGRCVPATAATCPGNFGCKNLVCNTACATSTDCGTGFDCDLTDGKCKVLLASGATCNPSLAGKDCKSGRCIDGVCCDTACGGSCNACAMAKTGVRNGTCAPIKAGTDPDDECAAESAESCGKTGVCDGQGACRLHADGTTCGNTCCSGGRGNDRPCSYVCRSGRCDKDQPVYQETCGGFSCCCPNGNGGGQAACTFPGSCPGGCS